MHAVEPPCSAGEGADAAHAGVPSLFARVLAADFASLPPSLRRLHDGRAIRVHHGEGEVRRGRGAGSRLCAALTRLPPEGTHAVTVEIAADERGETWTRTFGTHRMRSRLWIDRAVLRERLGLVTFAFRLDADAVGLSWHVIGARMLGIALPLRWFADVCAREFAIDGRYAFEIHAALPLVGLLVSYTGWLDVDA